MTKLVGCCLLRVPAFLVNFLRICPYEVSIDGKLFGRHNIPLVDNGHKQAIPRRDLPSLVATDQQYEIKVVTLDRTGQRSQPAVFHSMILKSGPAVCDPACTVVW